MLAAARPSELHKSAPSLQAEQSDVIQPLGLGSHFAICQLDLTRDVKYAPWPCHRAPNLASSPRTHRARSCVGCTQQFSDQKCNFISMCPLEACCGGTIFKSNGIWWLRVSYYSSSFALVFEDKPSFLLPQPDFQVSDNVYITLLDGSSTCIMERRLWHLKQTRKLWRKKKKKRCIGLGVPAVFFFFALWKMLVRGAKNESMWQRGREEE